MTMIADEVANKRRALPHLDDLVFVYLFGSMAKGENTARSDIELGLFYDIERKHALHRLLYIIDGHFPDRYEIQFFQLLPLYVQKEVFQGRLTYTSDRDRVYDIAGLTSLEYEYFERRYKFILYKKCGLEGAQL